MLNLISKVKPLISGCKKVVELPVFEKILCIQIFTLLFYYKLSLEILPLKYILPSLQSKSIIKPDESKKIKNLKIRDSRQFEKICLLVSKISKRLPFTDNCLLRSLTVYKLTQNKALNIAFKLGVRSQENKSLEAHAWLEDGYGNVIFEETDEEQSFHKLEKFERVS